MSDLAGTVERIFADHCTDKVRLAAERGIWPDALWRAVEVAGLPLALVDTGNASLGVTIHDAFSIVRKAGAHAAPIPLPETMLANWLLARAGLPPVTGPAVIVDRAQPAHVPWGRHATLVGAFATAAGCLDVRHLSPGEIDVTPSANIAREPRDEVRIRTMPGGHGVALSLDLSAARAALRTTQMAGAVEATTRITVDYVKTRVQFGKPLARFQAIQQQVAVLAEQAALAGAAADMATDAFARGIDTKGIAAAKILAGEAASLTCNIAHQIHGAIGFAQAYQLHHLTRRLWSWRDDDGNEAYWAEHLGTHLVGRSADQVWSEITTL